MQFHFDVKRESEPYALPDAEVFYVSRQEITAAQWDSGIETLQGDEPLSEPGWYYWACFPGCLPDSDPIGPFETEEEALADARESYDE